MKQIVLDTETTGIQVEEGHRIIEIGCLEMIDRKLTGRKFHQYINPERPIDSGAKAVHGLSNDFLKDKPLFKTIVREFIDFVSGAELIIHNAVFDLSFLNYELSLLKDAWKTMTDYCQVIDTLQIARQLHVGQRNSLDALCKRYHVDNSKRDLHDAMLDAHLLAQVYLAMTGGQGSFFDSLNPDSSINTKATVILGSANKHPPNLVVLKANDQELAEHNRYLENMNLSGKCLWLSLANFALFPTSTGQSP